MASNNLNTLTPIKRLFRLVSQFRKELRYIILYAVVAGLINLTLPLGIQAIINQIAGGRINASWVVLVLLVMVGLTFTGILRLMQLSIMEHLQRRIFTSSAIEFAVRIPRLNLEMLRREHLPELVNRFFDTLTLQKGMPKLLIDGSAAVLQIFFSLLLLSFYHASFVLFSVLLMFLLAVMFYWTGPMGIESSLKESKYKYRLAYWLEELGRVATTFKLAGSTPLPLQRADNLTVEYLNARSKHWRVLVWQFAGSITFRVLVIGGFLILGSMLVMENQLNIGQFVASEILVLFVVESVEKLIMLHETGYDVITATEKLAQVSELPVEREDGLRVEEFCTDAPLAVEMRNLSYQYDDGDSLVLKDINLKINPGEKVLIAGYHGSGKSTLMQILSVLKRDFQGSLLFNGLPKQNLHLRSLREHIGDISSQEDLFKGDILENITLGNPRITIQRVLEICELVGLSEFIRNHPQGINTELLPGGRNTPGSIVSKILIARAIAAKPKILVLEQPLGALNFRDRLRISQMLTDSSAPWTLVCSSDDPLLASMCQRVVVLKGGEIVFDGNFDDVRQTPHFERVFRANWENNL
ncbi:MAG: ATP-binding cassette domain-containing protein [Chitinophagales bacterium]|nr:ATP-binding cassette domain-containing protein [Chitinophagales bacterium]